MDVGGAGRMKGLERGVPRGRGEAAAAAGARMMVVRGEEKIPCICGTPVPLGRI